MNWHRKRWHKSPRLGTAVARHMFGATAILGIALSGCDGKFTNCEENATCPPPGAGVGGDGAGGHGGSGEGGSGEGGAGAASGHGGTGGDGGGSGSGDGGSAGNATGGSSGDGGGSGEGGSSGDGGSGGSGGKGGASGSSGNGGLGGGAGDGGSGGSGGEGGSGGGCSMSCTPGKTEQEIQACGKCGEQRRERTCQPNGCSWSEWTNWDTCTGEGVCFPDDTSQETEACGTCGSRTRTNTCSNVCDWIEGTWSTCELVPVCTPGESKQDPVPKACGNCGKSWRYSQCAPDGCSWGEPGNYGPCEGEGECAPNTTKQEETACQKCGTVTKTYTCSPQCNWGQPVDGPCTNQKTCNPGDVKVDYAHPCGDCDGTQTAKQTCTTNCTWGPWQPQTTCAECISDVEYPLCDSASGLCECRTEEPFSCQGNSICCEVPHGYNPQKMADRCHSGISACTGAFLCSEDSDCIASYHCDGFYCVPD